METNIRDRQLCADRMWDWGFLNDLFARPGMRFSDGADGRTENHGYFLEIEAKPEGKPVEGGQAKAYERRIRDDRTSVLYVWGEPGTPRWFQWLGSQAGATPCTPEAFRAEVAAWIDWAESMPWAPTLDRRHMFRPRGS